MQSIVSPIKLIEDQELIKLLEHLGNLKSEYPPKLFAARRAIFIAQVNQRKKSISVHQLHSASAFIRDE